MSEYKLIIGDKEINLSPGITKIGRAPESDIMLEDRRVSSKHAHIELIKDKLYIKDLNSRNGTFVNGSRVRGIEELSDGDTIQIIAHKFLVKMPQPDIELDATILDLSRPCSKCGRRVARDYHFCPHCGYKLEKAEIEEAVAAEEEMVDSKVKPSPFTKGTVKVPKDVSPIRKEVSATQPTMRKEVVFPSPIEGAGDYKPDAKRDTQDYESDLLIGKKAGGFWLRFIAYILDIIFVNLIGLSVITLLSWLILYFKGGANLISLIQGSSIQANTILPILYLVDTSLYSLICLIYILSGWARKGGTWGKRILGLKIYTKQGKTPIGWGKAILRLIGYFISSLILCIGFLMIGFTSRKRGLHDMIAGTYVVRE